MKRKAETETGLVMDVSNTAMTRIEPWDSLVVVAAGGTIEKDYPRSTNGYAFEFPPPAGRCAAERVLDNVRAHLGEAFSGVVVKRPVPMKDSTEYSAVEFEVLCASIAETRSRCTLVTHGTDTMIKTGLRVSELLGNNDAMKTIVITGAMRPEKFTDSDAAVNLGAALGVFSEALGISGVFISMHGQVIPVKRAARDDDGTFFVAV